MASFESFSGKTGVKYVVPDDYGARLYEFSRRRSFPLLGDYLSLTVWHFPRPRCSLSIDDGRAYVRGASFCERFHLRRRRGRWNSTAYTCEGVRPAYIARRSPTTVERLEEVLATLAAGISGQDC